MKEISLIFIFVICFLPLTSQTSKWALRIKAQKEHNSILTTVLQRDLVTVTNEQPELRGEIFTSLYQGYTSEHIFHSFYSAGIKCYWGGIQLDSVNLGNKVFRRFIIQEGWFNEVFLSSSDWYSARITQTKFVNCNFDAVDMRLSEFSACVFTNCSLKGIITDNADLSGSVFVNCDFAEAELEYADLTDCTFIKPKNLDASKIKQEVVITQ